MHGYAPERWTMADRTQPPYDETAGQRSPATDDLDPDGMDSESEGDELEAGGGDEEALDGDDNDDGVEPDGVRETPSKH
jgi:hypothetical protein